MKEELKQKIKKELVNLPKVTRDAINAFDWGAVADEIGKSHLFSEDEINNFQVETFLVIAGLSDLDSYTSSIENDIGTSADEAKKITDEVYEKIFTPIMEIMTSSLQKAVDIKTLNWEQAIGFILGGGDYSIFIEK